MKWINAKERLPEETGWYLVFAPSYGGRASTRIDGIMFAHFRINKNGTKYWDFESYGWPDCVLYWMPLPMPTEFGQVKTKPIGHGAVIEFWVDGDGKEHRFR